MFDPIQLGIVIALPGQTVGTHFDVPWFWGASRFNLPRWILPAMEQSRLFTDIGVRQSQGVAYLHSWINTTVDQGSFYFYPNGTEGEATIIPAEFNTAVVLDGAILAHGSDVFRPWQEPPKINPSHKNELRYVGEDKWLLISNDEIISTYQTSDFRISLVWRQRCFDHESEIKKWAEQKEFFNSEIVIARFIQDLREKGVIGKE